MTIIQKEIVRCLEEIIKNLKADNSNITEEQGIEILSAIAHIELSKEQACKELNLSRSRFDELVNRGKLPKGKKVLGFKELRWYKDEIKNAVKNIRKHI